MNQAFVQDAQYEINCDQGRENQERLVGEGRIDKPGPCLGNCRESRLGTPIRCSAVSTARVATESEASRREIE